MNRRRSLSRAIAALAVIGALALSGCAAGNGAKGSTYHFTSATEIGSLMPVADRRAAPGFSGNLLGGGTTTLAKSMGKVTVINFWASWCPPCRTETPQFEFAYQALKSKGVRFIGIDTKDVRTNAKTFIAANHVGYPIVYDPSSRVALSLGNIPGSLPFTVLLDSKHRVAAVYLHPLTYKDLQDPIDKLLAGH